MIKLTIDNNQVQVSTNTTILDAAKQIGITIPTLCCAAGYKPTTSCMVCVVQVEGLRSLVPACGTRAAEGMIVYTRTPQIQQARKTAIELLLSDHLGDCEGPCEIGCPAGMDIPKMIRQIAAGDFDAAIKTVKADIPLPAVCGRICPAPCEKVCRRKQADAAVAICLLKRFAADVDLAKQNPYTPQCVPLTGEKVAVVGAGPAGLTAAYYLRQSGIACTLYDNHEAPGGALRYANIDRTLLPIDVVDAEVEQILKLGIEFVGNVRIGKDILLTELKQKYDTVLISVGSDGTGDMEDVDQKDGKIQIDRQHYSTSIDGIYAAGGCTGSRNLCIRAVADGKEAAKAIKARLLRVPVTKSSYNHRMGLLSDDVMGIFLEHASGQNRTQLQRIADGFTTQQAQGEALRCLHCDCRKADRCGLRDRATELAARQKTWQGQTKLFELIVGNEAVVHEPGKCIKCGLCVQCAAANGQTNGLTFSGRGFGMEIAMPLQHDIGQMTHEVLSACIDICPTGALAQR